MDTLLDPLVFASALFLGMLACIAIGRRFATRAGDGERGVGAVEGAVFTLFGLLLAFTFSGAASRFDHRRDLIMKEANAIGTAWLRIDLLPADRQPEIRGLFRFYVKARLETYRDTPDPGAKVGPELRSQALQSQIWTACVAATQGTQPPAATLVVPALNDMFDVTTERQAATRTHPPAAVFLMLFFLGLAASLLTGVAMGTGPAGRLFHTLAFVVAITATVYVIMDMEYPRRGLIRVDAADRMLEDVLRGMGQP